MAILEIQPPPEQVARTFILTLTEGEALAVYATIGPTSYTSRQVNIRIRLGLQQAAKVADLSSLYSLLERAFE